MSPDDLVIMGKFGRPHGRDGRARLWVYNADSEFFAGRSFSGWVGEGPEARRVEVALSHWTERFAVVEVAGVRTREGIEELRNLEFSVARSELPDPGDDDFYLIDSLGWPVLIDDGAGELRPIGRVGSYMETGANGVIRVELDAGRTLLVPMVERAVREIGPGGERVVLHPLEAWAVPGATLEGEAEGSEE